MTTRPRHILVLPAAITLVAQHTGPANAGPATQYFTVGTTYTAEVLKNRSGGLRQDTAYVDNLDLTLEIDTEKLFGWQGTELFVYGLYNNGTPFSESVVGDLQVVSNIETSVRAFRLFEAWFRFDFANDADLLVGLYDLNSEFDVLESSQLFIGSAHGIGSDISQSGINGPSIFPASGLALRFARHWNDRWTLRTALLDGVPGDPEDPGDTKIRLSSEEGAILIGEVERSTSTGKVLAGVWAYTAEFAEDPLNIGTGTTAERRGNAGAYLRGETKLYDDESAVSVFGRLGYARGEFNVFEYFLGAGIAWRGMLARRPGDELGFAIAWGETSGEVEDRAGGQSIDIEPREVIAELTYRATISDHVTIQPHLHYIVNPGLDPSLADAFVAGLRVEITLF